MFQLRFITGKAIKRGKNRVLNSQIQAARATKRPRKALADNLTSSPKSRKTLSSPTIKPSLKKKSATKSKLSVRTTKSKVLPIAAPQTSTVRFVNKSSSRKTPAENTLGDLLLMRKFNMLLDKFAAELSKTTPSSLVAQVKQSKYVEEKYEYITQYGTQILSIFTPSSGCTYISRNFEKITGQATENWLGDKFFALLTTESQEKLRTTFCTISPSIVSEAKSQILRLKMQHGDGKHYWYQFTIHTQAQQYVCLIENINEHIQTQNTLQKARLEAELALRARSEFLANMSHELRTPLNAVIGFSQIMNEGIFGKIENPHYAEYIHHIQESGHDLLAKIEDLLEISNIDAGRISIDREEIYINDLIRHVLQTQSHHAKTAKVSLSYIPKGNILLFIDRLKLQHILGHLVTNAIKFNNAGGEVTIEINRDGKSGIRLSIHDNGVGMNDLKCHDIRESLQQENCWTAKNNQHIGIGLALTKEFIELHGGSVEVTSSAGIGTTVSITLPRDCIRIMPSRKIEQIKQLENG